MIVFKTIIIHLTINTNIEKNVIKCNNKKKNN